VHLLLFTLSMDYDESSERSSTMD